MQHLALSCPEKVILAAWHPAPPQVKVYFRLCLSEANPAGGALVSNSNTNNNNNNNNNDDNGANFFQILHEQLHCLGVQGCVSDRVMTACSFHPQVAMGMDRAATTTTIITTTMIMAAGIAVCSSLT